MEEKWAKACVKFIVNPFIEVLKMAEVPCDSYRVLYIESVKNWILVAHLQIHLSNEAWQLVKKSIDASDYTGKLLERFSFTKRLSENGTSQIIPFTKQQEILFNSASYSTTKHLTVLDDVILQSNSIPGFCESFPSLIAQAKSTRQSLITTFNDFSGVLTRVKSSNNVLTNIRKSLTE